jgi:hypothetical protein
MQLALIAAGALLAVSGPVAVAGAAAPTREVDRGAANPSTPGAETTPAPTTLDLLVAAAQAGNVAAMNDLGVLYSVGGSVPRDYSKALYWYQKAIDGGSPGAMSNLGMMYLYGVGLPRDYANAFRWFQHAAEHGNAHAMYSVAVMADIGMGTSRDPGLARAMYRKAAESGVTPAMVKVSDDYARGGASGDLVEAYAWLEVALQSGLPEELQIVALSKMDALGARLGSGRRDEARVRATQLAALMRIRALSGNEELAKPIAGTSSTLM